MENKGKTMSSAFILIRAIKICENIISTDKLNAIEDITRMLVDEEYALNVDFNTNLVEPNILIDELLHRLFDNNKSDMGRDFYLALSLNLSRDNCTVDSVITKNSFYLLKTIDSGDYSDSYEKPRERARAMLDSIKGCVFITDKDRSAAYSDIKRMLDDRKYAKSVDFGIYKFDLHKKESMILTLFNLSKTELGEVFYKALSINVERSGLWGWNNFFGGYTYEKNKL